MFDRHGPELELESGVPIAALRLLEALPSYYVHYYYQHDAEVALQSRPGHRSRAEVVAELEAKLLDEYRNPELVTKPAALSFRGGAFYSLAAVRLMASLHADTGDIQVVDMRNDGAIPGLPDEAVVELPAVVDACGRSPAPSACPSARNVGARASRQGLRAPRRRARRGRAAGIRSCGPCWPIPWWDSIRWRPSWPTNCWRPTGTTCRVSFPTNDEGRRSDYPALSVGAVVVAAVVVLVVVDDELELELDADVVAVVGAVVVVVVGGRRRAPSLPPRWLGWRRGRPRGRCSRAPHPNWPPLIAPAVPVRGWGNPLTSVAGRKTAVTIFRPMAVTNNDPLSDLRRGAVVEGEVAQSVVDVGATEVPTAGEHVRSRAHHDVGAGLDQLLGQRLLLRVGTGHRFGPPVQVDDDRVRGTPRRLDSLDQLGRVDGRGHPALVTTSPSMW